MLENIYFTWRIYYPSYHLNPDPSPPGRFHPDQYHPAQGQGPGPLAS